MVVGSVKRSFKIRLVANSFFHLLFMCLIFYNKYTLVIGNLDYIKKGNYFAVSVSELDCLLE